MKDETKNVILEFCFTYGWAILVILVCVGALAYFGLISPDNVLPNVDETQCELVCNAQGMDYSGEYEILENNTIECKCNKRIGYSYSDVWSENETE